MGEQDKLLVIAIAGYDPQNDDDQEGEETNQTAPEVSSQLSFQCCDRFEVIDKEVNWWLNVICLKTQHQGYIPSSLVAPLRQNLTQQEEWELAHGAELSPHLVNADVNLKFFPGAPREKDVINRVPCPEDKANFFSIISFWWMNSLIVKGHKRPLLDEDMWALNKRNKASHMVPRIDRKYSKEQKKFHLKQSKKKKVNPQTEETVKLKDDNEDNENVSFKPESKTRKPAKKKNPSLVKVLVQEFCSVLLLGVFYKFLHDCLAFCQPQLLALIIEFTENSSIPEWRGYVIAFAMLVVAFVQSIFLHQYFHIAFSTGMRLRTCVLGLVYKKALVLTSESKRQSTAGEMVNLMSVDAQRLMDLMSYINQVWSAPFQILLALVFLYNTMGVSILAGFAVMLLLIPMNICVTRIMRKLQSKLMLEKDKRIKMMNEILSGIKILKLYAWEESFMKKIFGIRNVELKHLRNNASLNAGFTFSFTCSPFMVSLATFAVYVYTGNELTSSKAFVALSLFNLLSFPVTMLPFIISSIIQAQVSIRRLTDFLNLEELDPGNIKREIPDHLSTQSIHIEEASFGWEKGEKPVLTNINLNIPSGSLVAVVGQVGCGKSTLLSSLLGETEKIAGEVYMKGTVAYVAQQAWIQNATLRDNILFGRMFISKRYCKAVKACALRTDLDILPGGDQTEIGERGINLSGGQKQRVSLARAVYFDADVYLLDDPLSAVDSHVGKHIFDRVIGPRGLLRKKTRILVTHGLSFLPQVDQIIVLQDGKISEVGTYRELLSNEGAFAEFIKTYAAEQEVEKKEEEFPTHEEHYMSQEGVDIIAEYQDAGQVRARSTSVLSINTFTSTGKTECGFTGKDTDVDKMIGEERSETGRVKLSVFLSYARSIGLVISFFFVIFLVAAEASLIGSGVWLARWSTTNVTTSSERDMYMGVYGGLGLSQALLVLFSSLAMALGSMIASRNLHTHLLNNIMHSAMSFFETTPLGRIVNRFSKDIEVIDNVIPRSLTSFLRTFLTVVGTMAVISYATPIFLSAIVPLVIVYVIVQRYYVASSRQLKRIESVSRSPIYNHFFETINGSSTIRAYWLQQHFIRENYYRIDENQVAYYPSIAANRWLALRLEFLGTCIIFFAALFSVASRENTNSGLVGLAITYALKVTSSLNWMVRQTSELETNIVSVERVKEYSETPTEAEWIYPDSRPKDDWPTEGRVEFDGFDLKYREGLPLVLKHIDCTFKPCEKIGIVGRTGAGKSSLTLALFRILEAAGGKIVIDGVDISKIGLHDLRSRLTIIPQDPVLFSGTLRLNLDPFDKYSDDDLWRVLEISHLKTFVSSLEEGLLHPVTEGGENLSVGQRQLVCLARALLRKSKILVLDEATAAVDLETDELIQKTIRHEFADRTVMTIAHRLNTIIDYSRILVLDKGFIVEFDTPSNLLDRKGIFYSMARDAGLV